MRNSLGRMLLAVVGPAHGNGLSWVGWIASLAWLVFLTYPLALCLESGSIFVVLPLIGMPAAVAGLRWHLVPAVLLTSIGVSSLGAWLLRDPVEVQPAQLLFALALTGGGIVNALAWVSERKPSRLQSRWRYLEAVAGIVCGLPGLALLVLSLWSYSGLGDDCEWGQDTMFGGLTVVAAFVGCVLSLGGLFGGMCIFRCVSRLWQDDKPQAERTCRTH